MCKKNQNFITALLVFMLFVMSVVPVQIYAQDGTNMKSEIALLTNMSKEIKLPAGVKNVKWKSSDKSMVSILGISGKGNRSVTIKSSNKTGSCTITAKSGQKTYKYKILVKKGINISRASLVKVKQTKKNIKLRIKLSNNTNSVLWYGYEYWIEKFENGKWRKLPVNQDIAFEGVAIEIPANSSRVLTYTIASDKPEAMYLRSQLKKGTYRIHISANFEKDDYNYVIFCVK